jgi:hypothetical protein
MGRIGIHTSVFVVKTEGTRSRGRFRGSIIMDLREVGWGGVDWIVLPQNMATSLEHGNDPSDSIKCWEILEKLSDWRLLKKSSPPWS